MKHLLNYEMVDFCYFTRTEMLKTIRCLFQFLFKLFQGNEELENCRNKLSIFYIILKIIRALLGTYTNNNNTKHFQVIV